MSTVQDNTKLINAITRFMTYVIANRSLKLENDRLVAMDSLKGFDTKKTLDSLFLTTVDKYTVIARTENKFNISSIKEEDILKAVTCEDLIKLATDPLRSQKEDKAKPKATPTASLQNKVLKSVTEQLEEPVTEKEKTMEEELREETPEEVEEMPEEAVEETPEEVEEIPEETVNEDDEVPEETVEEIPEETVEDEAEDGIPEIRLLDHCCSTCKDREECIAKSNKEGLK